MDQRKLYRTVESIASQKLNLEEVEMLIETLNQVVKSESINVNGGRIWKLNPETGDYQLLYQTGNIRQIEPDFKINVANYPIFDLLSKERTIVGFETDEVLKQKGILKFSASGVGDKIKLGDKYYYEYLLALNKDDIDDDFKIMLSIVATSLTSQIKQRRYRERANVFKADLDKGRELQKSILPQHEYSFQNYEMFGVTDPAEIVGGDFFDYLEIGEDNERLGVVVGDAASKGVSASAEAMYISGAIRMASSFEIKIGPLMKRTNQIVNKIFADDRFASLFYGELSADKSGLFLFSNAGHNPPIFVKRDSNEIKRLDPTGPVLGPAPHSRYTIDSINFGVGDVLLIFSDGVTDSANSKFEGYGEDRLIKTFQKSKHLTPKEIVYTILEDVVKYSRNGEYSDDKTLVVIKKTR
jgi:sigma-B regulation protein RsbU (phosphoserine phosphatase)